MILSMYAIKDELNGFTALIPFPNDEMAKRYLKDQAYENPTVKINPEDFSIWYICSFDTQTGKISQAEQPRLIERAKNYGTK